MFEAYDIYKGLNEILFKDLDEVFTLYNPKSYYILNNIADDILFLTIDRYKGYKTLIVDVEDYMDDSSVSNLIVLLNNTPCNLHDNHAQYLMNNKLYIVSDYVNKNQIDDIKIFNIKRKELCTYNVSTVVPSYNSTTQTLIRINKDGIITTNIGVDECVNIVISIPSVRLAKGAHVYDLSKSLIKPSLKINNGVFVIDDTDVVANKHMTRKGVSSLTLVFYKLDNTKTYYTDFLSKYKSNIDGVDLSDKTENVILKELFHFSDIENLTDEDKFEYIETLDFGLFDKLYDEKYRTHETVNTFMFKKDIGKAISNITTHGVTFKTPRIYFTVDNLGQKDYEVYINGKFIHQRVTCINNLSVSHMFVSLSQIYDVNQQNLIKEMCEQNKALKDKVTSSFTSFDAGVNILVCQFENDFESFIDIFGDIIISDLKINIIRRYNDYIRFESGITKQTPHVSIPDIVKPSCKHNVFIDGRYVDSKYYRAEYIGGVYHLIFNDTYTFGDDNYVIPVTITYYNDDDDVVDIKLVHTLSADKYVENSHNLDTDYYIDGINMNHASVCCKETSTKTYFNVIDSNNTKQVVSVRRFDLSDLHNLKSDYRDLLITSLNILASVRNKNFPSKTFSIGKVNIPTNDINFETYVVYLKYFINKNTTSSTKGILSAEDINYIKNNYPNVVVTGDTIELTNWSPTITSVLTEDKSKILLQNTKLIAGSTTGDIVDNGYVLTGDYKGQLTE